VFSDADLKFFANNTASDVVQKVVSKYPQEAVLIVDSAELEAQSYAFFVKLFKSSLESVDDANLVKYNDKDNNLAFANFNEASIKSAAIFISDKKLKLNYNYQTTWSIFVVLTFIALIVAFLLKMEDKRKGYGLQLPNIKEEA